MIRALICLKINLWACNRNDHHWSNWNHGLASEIKKGESWRTI